MSLPYSNVTEQLQKLRQEDTDVALILDTFEEIEHVYSGALEAMGVPTAPTNGVSNSAELTVSFRPTASSSES